MSDHWSGHFFVFSATGMTINEIRLWPPLQLSMEVCAMDHVGDYWVGIAEGVRRSVKFGSKSRTKQLVKVDAVMRESTACLEHRIVVQ